MSDKKVQIIVRVTEDEKITIKRRAKEQNKSMNQFIIDSTLDITSDSEDIKKDSTYDSPIIEVLKVQLANKDKQIDKLQTLLDQQQQLSLSDKKEKEQLRIELQQIEETKEEATENTYPWWQFWR